jgi:hypothetical protein
MKQFILVILIVLSNYITTFGQTIPIPKNYSIVDTVLGDLDKDGIKELVVAYDTRKAEDEYESVPRELIIYKKQNNKWAVWKKSSQALLGSRDGGMMGDPFGELTITNGILLISHYGGSSWKWGHTDKYRYSNGEFYLIGHSGSYGKPCEYWQEVDFNLVTGKMIVKKEYEDCDTSDQAIYKRENETLYKKGIKIILQNRNDKEIKIVTPKYRHEIYIAVKD